jgi:DNA-directed RNA polymerase alpha subunit
MNPSVTFTNDENDVLSFTLSGVNVSLANAIRRTILSDIPQLVFKTSPYEENKSTIIVNTSSLNNEIIKQRLSCIPIHITDENFPYKNYLLEVNVENNTDTMLYVTTEDFKIKDLLTNNYLSEQQTRTIFPSNPYTGYFIDFVRLRPRISNELPGDKIHMTCEFQKGNAKEDGMFNVVSTCSYGFTVDDVKCDEILEKKKQEWKNEGKTKEEISFEEKNWRLLEGMRVVKKDSYDFTIETVGVYTNNEILDNACTILISKLDKLDTIIEKDELEINVSQNTMTNCYDIILENDDYTIGKIIEYLLLVKYYETKILTFCGYKKMHPHDTSSIIRVAYKDAVEKSTIKGNLKECVETAKQIYGKIKKEFLKLMKNK